MTWTTRQRKVIEVDLGNITPSEAKKKLKKIFKQKQQQRKQRK